MSHRLATLWLSLAVLLLTAGVANAGYTHYFNWKIDPSGPKLDQCIAEMKVLINARKQMLETTPPNPKYQGGDAINFNGVGDDEYEDFVFPGNTPSHELDLDLKTLPPILIGANFCKTAYKPYDQVVTACLIVAREHFTPGELVISSDGSWDDWQAGRKLYEETFGRTANDPMQDSPGWSPPTGVHNRRGLWVGLTGIGLLVLINVLLNRRGTRV